MIRSNPRTIQPLPSRLTALLNEIAERRKLSREEILSPREFPAFVAARDELWYRAQEINPRAYSAQRLGHLFGRRHSTVSRGAKRHQARGEAS